MYNEKSAYLTKSISSSDSVKSITPILVILEPLHENINDKYITK